MYNFLWFSFTPTGHRGFWSDILVCHQILHQFPICNHNFVKSQSPELVRNTTISARQNLFRWFNWKRGDAKPKIELHVVEISWIHIDSKGKSLINHISCCGLKPFEGSHTLFGFVVPGAILASEGLWSADVRPHTSNPLDGNVLAAWKSFNSAK